MVKSRILAPPNINNIRKREKRGKKCNNKTSSDEKLNASYYGDVYEEILSRQKDQKDLKFYYFITNTNPIDVTDREII